jgi:hypothetical protein
MRPSVARPDTAWCACTPFLARAVMCSACDSVRVDSIVGLAGHLRVLEGTMKKLVVTLMLALCCLLLTPALASASKPTVKSLAKSLAALQKTVKSQATTIASQGGTIASLSGDLATAKQSIATLQSTVADQGAKLTAAAPLLAIAPYVSLTAGAMNGVAGPNVVFQGVNLHVRSSASEDDTSGLGNLIVGWDNDPPVPLSGYRSGSNNLVCGDLNSFLNNGSFLAGQDNVCREEYASVSGGYNNTASGVVASVSGGDNNIASGLMTSISGGAFNHATINLASVSGGFNNTASGLEASVSGGRYNTASGTCASISGGGGDTMPVGLTLSANYGWAAGNTATPGTGTAKFVAP